ncbi:MAG: hypothetical protein WCH04_21180 [Gammaproteobacteria bacterium]
MLGFPGKMGMSGARVWDSYLRQRHLSWIEASNPRLFSFLISASSEHA